ncbi:MAG: alpha/beta fold hydrolase [Acidimicrobiia bacterium]
MAEHALILIHGWTATARVNWGGVLDRVGDHYRVFAPDLHGHGKGHRDRKHFRLEDSADDIVRLLDEEGLDDAIVVGYSLGGAVAQLVWRRHPDRVRGLVLCSTAPWFRSYPIEWVNSFALRGAAAALQRMPLEKRNRVAMKEAARRTRSELLDEVKSELSGHDWGIVLEAGARIMRFDSREWVGEIDVPTSVIVTVDDTVIPAFRQFVLADTIPNAHLYTLTGDHSVCLHQPAKFGATLVRAVADVAADARTIVSR